MANEGTLQMAQEAWGSIKDQKISLGLVGVVLYILYVGYGWADATFLTRAEAAEDVRSVQQSIDRMSGMLEVHIKDYTISKAQSDVERIESDIWHLSLHENQNGETEATKELRRSLKEKQRRAREYLGCLMDERPNCKHLEFNG